MSSQADVEAELARLKAGAAPRPEAIEAAPTAASILERRAGGAARPSRRASMIVRILGEGQYDVADDALDRLNELDARRAAVEAGDEAAFARALTELLDGVRTAGAPHAADSLDESDLILPPADATIDEVRDLLSGDGLIPG